MDVEIVIEDPWTIIVAGATAGTSDSEEWLSLFDDLYERGIRYVIIDCQQIAVPTSPFMSALVWGGRVMERGQGRSCAVGCNERIQRALAITGLADSILQAASIEDAKRLIGQT